MHMSTIIIRRPRFDHSPGAVPGQLQRKPVAAAFYTLLSATFPAGEAFFVRSVRRFEGALRPGLRDDVRAFAAQEAIHAREHLGYNHNAGEGGVDLSEMSARAKAVIEIVERRSPEWALAVTLSLEHFTAILAHEILRRPHHIEFMENDARRLWRWHALEEIEHKSVAFDVYLAVTRDWSPLRRWTFRCRAMLHAKSRLAMILLPSMRDLLRAQPGRHGWLRIMGFLFGFPGPVRALLLPMLAFFRPGFHPDQCDEASLIEPLKAEFAAA
jgi:uncharacterized protein